jgi:hypothetical protein
MANYRGTGEVSHPDTRTPDAWQALGCAYCGNGVSGLVVAYARLNDNSRVYWLQCTLCGEGSVKHNGVVRPGSLFGPSLTGLPAEIAAAYEEIRHCMSVGAFVAAELVCRKVLMHVAVEKGDQPNRSFAQYIDFLAEHGYVTPPMERWVQLIRTRGNEATGTFERRAKKLGLPRIRFHDLRHTHATLGLEAGIPPKVMQERLGHSSITMTLDLYSHVIPGMQKDAATRIAALIDATA